MCPTCGKPLALRRKRCYFCKPGRAKTGSVHACETCQREFYVPGWVEATARQAANKGEGRFCSRACMYEARRIKGPGARIRRADGYIAVYYPAHPDARSGGIILEHRLVAEQKYGRRILPSEHVNHINGIRDDNRPENLEVVSPSAHAGISNRQGQAKRAQLKAELAEYRRRFGTLTDWEYEPGR